MIYLGQGPAPVSAPVTNGVHLSLTGPSHITCYGGSYGQKVVPDFRSLRCFTGGELIGLDLAILLIQLWSVLPGLGWACHAQPTIIALSSSLRL